VTNPSIASFSMNRLKNAGIKKRAKPQKKQMKRKPEPKWQGFERVLAAIRENVELYSLRQINKLREGRNANTPNTTNDLFS
jgi:hypothetical protein